MEAKVTLILKRHYEKTTLLIILMNIDAKPLNKILANQVQKYIKRITSPERVEFILAIQGQYENQFL